MHRTESQIVVIGAGLAGLATALRLAPLPVTLITAGPLGREASTPLAQGGLAAALGADDSADAHAADTIAAAAGLAQPEIVRDVTAAAGSVVSWLETQGVRFDRSADGRLALGREAAHGHNRIIHAGGDRTGAEIEAALCARLRQTPSVRIVEQTRVERLLRDGAGRVRGVQVRGAEGGAALPAAAIVLATGGIGGLFASTTNPLGSVGTGITLAAEAGAVLRDLEFVQFHPTAIDTGAAPLPLATEALRGAGAGLVDEAGGDLMALVPGGALAARDVIAARLHRHLQAGGRAFLDLPPALAAELPQRFPGVAALCAEAGISLADRRIPVRPAAHYHMGGIRIDRQARTSLPGLWACGEVASSGLHGANRLASNSLLEAVVTAGWVAEDIAAQWPTLSRRNLLGPAPEAGIAPQGRAPLVQIRAIMETHLGIVRSEAGMSTALAALLDLHEAAPGDLAITAALLVAASAYRRRESRGAHRRSDFPSLDPKAASQEITLADALNLARDLRVATAAE